MCVYIYIYIYICIGESEGAAPIEDAARGRQTTGCGRDPVEATGPPDDPLDHHRQKYILRP